MAVIAGVLGFTVNPLNDPDVPFGVVTVSFLDPIGAVGEMVRVASRVVSDAVEMDALIPFPSKVSAVAPLRFAPLIVTGTT
jgi:hypothetical protein